MSQTLYRKYRPGTFEDVIGQNHIKTTLQNEIVNDSVAHAYLFSGPRGTGKTTIARILAKSLNCSDKKDKEFEPCGKCLSCQEIIQSKSLDLIEIDAASNTGVDNVRENIIDNVRFTPYRDKYKVFIIDEVHMLSVSAFNALLKTLEEPPEHVVFVLCTTELYKLPETIVSRCQRFDFKKVDLNILSDYLLKISQLEQIKVDKEIIKRIAFGSGGFVRDALSTLGQVLSINKKEITIEDAMSVLPRSDFNMVVELVDYLIEDKPKEAIELINRLVEEGVDLEQFNLDLIDYFRKLSLVKLKIDVSNFFDSNSKIYEQAEKVNMDDILKMTNVFVNKVIALKNAEIVQLPLEMAIIEICKTDNIKKVENIQPVVRQEVKSEVKKEEIQEEKKIEEKKEIIEPKVEIKQEKKDIDISLQKIIDKWDEIVANSQSVNHSTTVALQTAHPVSLEGDTVEIAFEHSFYCERFKEVKSRQLIEQVLKNVLNCDLVVKCLIMTGDKKVEMQEKRKEKKDNAEDKINSIAEDFGGKIVG
ncbi:MAG: DNA polymerase III subunit gamma/tau [Patescibacteria group bacterium]